MTDVFIDCEFDGFKGELISMGLYVSDENYLYIVLKDTASDPWVQKNVIPYLEHERVNSRDEALYLVEQFFENLWFDDVRVIADWWADIKHLCDFIEYDGGMCLDIESLDFVVMRRLTCDKCRVPHNAIYDAEALRANYGGKDIKEDAPKLKQTLVAG